MTFELTDAERRLVDAVREGEVACYNSGDPITDDPRSGDTWRGEGVIRAEIIRTLLTESNSP
jgi:hypothetical protein